MLALFYILHVIICIFLILVVLLQQGKGADLSVFGGGGTMTAFGARGAATMLHKLTVASFVGFILTTIAIGIFKSREESSVLQGLDAPPAATAPQTPGEDAVPAGVLPEAEPAADGAETSDGEPATGTEATGDAGADSGEVGTAPSDPPAEGEAEGSGEAPSDSNAGG